jgi:2-phospho-L-lactate transferase/gluconeogenesis factor (CofD/UPF0052 family)
VIVNTGDDFEWHGLHVCPDLDTVTYTLAGWANPHTGWGVEGDTYEALNAMQRWGVEAWFKIGDRDLATHVRRTELLRQGKTLTEATQIMTRALGIKATILPMTDDRFRTLVETDEGCWNSRLILCGGSGSRAFSASSSTAQRPRGLRRRCGPRCSRPRRSSSRHRIRLSAWIRS